MTETITRDRDNKQLVITRSVRGGRTLAWACWTEPHHLREWWGPKGWRCDIFELDLRPGGLWRYRLRPDRDHELDEEHWGHATYESLEPHESLMFLDGASTPEGTLIAGTEMPTAVALTESEPGMCDIRITVRFPTIQDLEHAEAIGMVTGFTETLERLDCYLNAATPEVQA